MSDKDQRTERATSKKRGKERDEGHVAVSKELIGMAVLLAAGSVLVLDPLGARPHLVESVRRLFASLDQVEIGRSEIWLRPLVFASLAFVLPVGFAAMIAAIVSGGTQTKWLMTTKKLKVKFDFLNPLPRLKEMFGSIQALTTLLLSLGKVAVVGVVVVNTYTQELPKLKTLGRLAVGEVMLYLGAVTLRVALQAGAILILFAIADYLLIVYRYEQQIKMTKQEVKDEHKDMEGDPQVKQKQRQKMREVGRRMMAEVPKAAVVVVNPTHYAVALRYEASEMAAPRVIAKGKDKVAAKIREIARHHGIPIVRNPPLTRKLYAECALDSEIPPALYAAIAEVLALVFRLRGGLVGASA